jgi:hypothetical protein|tara:strand:- start:364 stop:654 length:291 start_codon:yes stop_codon:yes gene_type:complete
MAIYANDWHVQGIVGDAERETLVVGTESDCRFLAKLMVSSGRWDNAWLHPPGSDSGSDYEHEGPLEVYTVPNMGGVQGTESHSIKWRGWEHEKFQE